MENKRNFDADCWKEWVKNEADAYKKELDHQKAIYNKLIERECSCGKTFISKFGERKRFCSDACCEKAEKEKADEKK